LIQFGLSCLSILNMTWKSMDTGHVKSRFLDLQEQFSRYFYYGTLVDSWLGQIILIPYITLQWKSSPTWVRIIGPSSSGKSAHISLLDEHELSISLDELTPKSLMSGYRGRGEDPSKIPQFDGKVVVISDESTLMEQRPEDRNIIQAVLRRAYDGKISKSFGNIKEVVEAKAHFNILVAATPVIDRYFQYTQALGERYINFRLQIPDPGALTKRASENLLSGAHAVVYDKIRMKVHKFLDKMPAVNIDEVNLPTSINKDLILCSNFLARLRTHVLRDVSGKHVTTLPRQEGGGRLVQQLTQAAIALSIIQGDFTVKRKHLDITLYMALCSVPELTTYSLYVARKLSVDGDNGKRVWFSSREFTLRTGLGRTSVSQILEDLSILRILEIRVGSIQGGRSLEYTLDDETAEIIDDLDLFKSYCPPVKFKSSRKLDRYRTL